MTGLQAFQGCLQNPGAGVREDLCASIYPTVNGNSVRTAVFSGYHVWTMSGRRSLSCQLSEISDVDAATLVRYVKSVIC